MLYTCPPLSYLQTGLIWGSLTAGAIADRIDGEREGGREERREGRRGMKSPTSEKRVLYSQIKHKTREAANRTISILIQLSQEIGTHTLKQHLPV